MGFIVVRNRAALDRLVGKRPRQAKRKKPPPKKPPAGPREASVVKSILLYLADAGVKAWRVNAGVSFANGRAVRGAPAGTSDVIGCLPGGRMLCVEAKRPRGGRTTATQSAWLAGMEAQGALCVVARSARDVYAALLAAGYAVPEPRQILL